MRPATGQAAGSFTVNSLPASSASRYSELDRSLASAVWVWERMTDREVRSSRDASEVKRAWGGSGGLKPGKGTGRSPLGPDKTRVAEPSPWRQNKRWLGGLEFVSMEAVLVESASSSVGADVSRFEAEVHAETARRPDFRIRFAVRSPVAAPAAAGDAWLAALLLPAMFAGEDLEVRLPVSARLTRTANEIQALMHSWYPDFLNRITVRTPRVLPRALPPQERGAVAVFFSGGVDSWYSLLRNREEVTHLLTVKGFDVPSADQELWPEIVRTHERIAVELGKTLVTIETDLRDHVDPSHGCFQKPFAADFWGKAMHGAGMAAVGLLLQHQFSRVIVPASWQYARLQPWGSHPVLDALWSNGQVEFWHDGAEASRLEKIRSLAGSQTALRHLRVCPSDRPGRYNCGVCEKCRRTMLTLRLFGVLDQARSFDQPLDFRAVELMPVARYLYPLYREILAEARARGEADVARLVRILIGDKFSARRRWHFCRQRAGALADRAARKIGLPRWKRSLLKRLPARWRPASGKADGGG